MRVTAVLSWQWSVVSRQVAQVRVPVLDANLGSEERYSHVSAKVRRERGPPVAWIDIGAFSAWLNHALAKARGMTPKEWAHERDARAYINPRFFPSTGGGVAPTLTSQRTLR